MVEGRTHKPVIDNEKCNVCAVCLKGCPAEAVFSLRQEDASLRGRIYKGVKTPPTLNADKVFDMPPCQLTCPLHQDVRGYINLIFQNKYEEALAVIREANALPSVCGYVCHHPCEEKCVRNLVDDPVAIRVLKRFVADADNGEMVPPLAGKRKDKKVAIIGSGPAGLAAAYDLVRMGHEVEVLEAYDEPGGMLRWAIPPFRLPREVLNRDIKYIEKLCAITNMNGETVNIGRTQNQVRGE